MKRVWGLLIVMAALLAALVYQANESHKARLIKEWHESYEPGYWERPEQKKLKAEQAKMIEREKGEAIIKAIDRCLKLSEKPIGQLNTREIQELSVCAQLTKK